MSATLAGLLRELMPDVTTSVYERLHEIAFESTQTMNNAGTGHAGNCELNYTPLRNDGSIDISKAIAINGAFETSLQFWSHLVEKGRLPEASEFINPVPHSSLVWGDDNRAYLRARHRALSSHPMFSEMEFTEDRTLLNEWMPVVMEERALDQRLAATRVMRGTDVDFGRLTQALMCGLDGADCFDLHLRHNVKSIHRHSAGGWLLEVKDLATGNERSVHAKFVFLGAGGGSLPLLQMSGIPEGLGYGGFPVSGQWLVCSNPTVVNRHQAKVYGKAAVGSPPMSLPHLDTRYWRGQKALLFGPFAGFTTKYLKEGSYLDLFKSLRPHNLGPMLAVARDNWDLTHYLFGQAMQSAHSRLAALREYMPGALSEDWEFAVAGQRVQIIKRDEERTGRLEFGTEVVTSADGSLAALLGASPGASTAVEIMLELLQKCFPERTSAAAYQCALKEVIPSCGYDLASNVGAYRRVRDRVDSVLALPSRAGSNLNFPGVVAPAS